MMHAPGPRFRFSKVMVVGALLAAIGGAHAMPVSAVAPGEAPAAAPARERGITVVGEGKVKVRPDIATANIGVEVVRADVKDASSAAAAQMDAVLAALRKQGVATADIQTSFYNIWVERPYAPEGRATTEVIYHVTNQMQVTIRALDKVTTTIGAAIEAGANSINGISFQVEEPRETRSRARRDAFADAQAKAEELAALAGATLGEVVSVSEMVNQFGPFPGEMAMSARGGGGDGGPIVPGEVEVTMQLQVVFAIE